MKTTSLTTPTLRQLLWSDTALGCTTALIGLIAFRPLTTFLGLPTLLIIVVSAITMVYGIVAFTLAVHTTPPPVLLRVLVYANWFAAVLSIILLVLYVKDATIFGQVFLVLQVLVIGGLAYLEGRYV